MAQTATRERSSGAGTQLTAGSFCWVDLATTDTAAAKKFYGAVFGWQFEDRVVGGGMNYSFWKHGDDIVGAFYEFESSSNGQTLFPRWDSYVLVDSVDKTVAQAKKLGGKILTEPFDVFDEGRMAMIEDPVGAGICVWQAESRWGVDRSNAPGSMCWNELHTTRIDKAKTFYTDLFGWKAGAMKRSGQNYTRLINANQNNGGITSEFSKEGDSGWWVAYFATENLDDALRTVGRHGGSVVGDPIDSEYGSLAIARDPQGAYFGLFGPRGK